MPVKSLLTSGLLIRGGETCITYMICHFACFDPRNALVKFMLCRILRSLENMSLVGNQCMEEN